MRPMFWNGKRVFLTGHTGFKGGWLALWLQSAGSEVTGYSLAPPTRPSLFEIAQVGKHMHSVLADIRDAERLQREMRSSRPDIVIHMAAQPLVRESYREPVATFETNVTGTVNVLEAVRQVDSVETVLVVTTDKCYHNRGWVWGYRENDELGGSDPYSSSKACAELATAAYRSSFLMVAGAARRVGVGSGRAGNVIGGGDWALDRLVPDAVRAFSAGEDLVLRNPESVRPWQHVLGPLHGYVTLLERLHEDPAGTSGAWNFGPSDQDCRPVREVVARMASRWGDSARWTVDDGAHPHEAHYLTLDSSKAHRELGWAPQLSLDDALDWTVEWHRSHLHGKDMRDVTLSQIQTYMTLLSSRD